MSHKSDTKGPKVMSYEEKTEWLNSLDETQDIQEYNKTQESDKPSQHLFKHSASVREQPKLRNGEFNSLGHYELVEQ